MPVRAIVLSSSLAAACLAALPASAQMPQMVLPPSISGPGPTGPIAEPTRPAQEGQAAAPAEPALAAKPRPAAKPIPTVTLTNASASTATEIVVSAGDMTAKLDKPLLAKAKASLRLPKLKGCVVSVAASFEGEGQVEVGEFNVCKDKSIRFTD